MEITRRNAVDVTYRYFKGDDGQQKETQKAIETIVTTAQARARGACALEGCKIRVSGACDMYYPEAELTVRCGDSECPNGELVGRTADEAQQKIAELFS